MIKLKKLELETVEVFDPNGKSLGFANYFEFTDLRIQIKEQKLNGYFIVYDNNEHLILNNGKVVDYPNGLFNLIDEQLDKLLDL